MKKLLCFPPVLLLLIIFPLSAQEFVDDDTEEQQTEIPLADSHIQEQFSPDDTLYVITVFEFDITGRTRPNRLMYNGEFQEGEKLKGQAALDTYIREKTQMLVNQRVLKDNAVVTYSIGEQQEDGAYLVTIFINVEDTWNIIALPYPKYSTNTGFEFILKARDYNFLGSMNPLRIDLGYYHDENGHNSFALGIESNTPFRALGYVWNFKFNNTFGYRPEVEEPYYYQNVTGLSMELPFRNTTFTFGFEESFNLNEENADRYKEQYGDFQSGLYMSTKLYTSWKIPTGLRVSRYGELTYNPGISATFNHELPLWPLDEIRKGPFLNFSHSLGFERINWYANFRDGLSVSLNNSYTYNFYRMQHNEDPWSNSLTLTGTGHFVINQFFGISSRLQYRQWFYNNPNYYDEAGDALRGIADKALTADYMLSLNLDFPLRVLVFTPSRWFNNHRMSFFDFEMHIAPIVDVALYHDPRTGVSFSPRNIATTGGFEFIVFPAFMRSLYARLSLGWNLRELVNSQPFKLPGGQNREITFIIGHFY